MALLQEAVSQLNISPEFPATVKTTNLHMVCQSRVMYILVYMTTELLHMHKNHSAYNSICMPAKLD